MITVHTPLRGDRGRAGVIAGGHVWAGRVRLLAKWKIDDQEHEEEGIDTRDYFGNAHFPTVMEAEACD